MADIDGLDKQLAVDKEIVAEISKITGLDENFIRTGIYGDVMKAAGIKLQPQKYSNLSQMYKYVSRETLEKRERSVDKLLKKYNQA